MDPTRRAGASTRFQPRRSASPLLAHAGGDTRRKVADADTTHAEAFFYQKLLEGRAPLTVRLRDGEELTGTVAWFDRGAVRLDRPDGSHVVVVKQAIAYLFRSGG